MRSNEDSLSVVRNLLASSRAIVVLTGAGVSAESKVPTFRDTMEGLWAEFDPQRLATPEAFAADPEMVTRWYDWRRLRCLEAEPNPGHLALAELERRATARGAAFTLLTQNVDGLHNRAGSSRVVELHGSIHRWRGERTGEAFELPDGPLQTFPPLLPSGERARPGVVWFGEMLPSEAVAAAEEALDACDLFFSVGTSAVVFPAAGFVHAAKDRGAATVEINPEATPITGLVDHALAGKSGEVLPLLAEG